MIHPANFRNGERIRWRESRMGKRQMHLGVFVLGTGNHSAGWRYDGAATSNNQLPVIQEIARTAERGKFDLLFVSDGLVMNPGDHPSFLCRSSRRP